MASGKLFATDSLQDGLMEEVLFHGHVWCEQPASVSIIQEEL
jgi:hypothetical protein